MSARRLVLFATLVLSASIALPASLLAAADVETIAGSGASGIHDGPARSATFLFPFGIAIDRDGSMYISDRAAQRIRLLTASGEVRTVAGSGPIVAPGLMVRPGYADGPALQAQFAGPEGLAIAPDGALFIADSYNFCIRKLFHDQVTTAIGKCGYAGTADGAADAARFMHPKALAFDAAGNLYIADDGAGLRKFGTDGALTTIRFKSYSQPSARGVAVAAQGDTVLVATLDGVVAYHPSTGTDERFPLRPPKVPLNVPNQIVAVGAQQFVFSDPLSHNIRYLRLGQAGHAFTRAIAGGEFERGTDNAGYADGGRSAARFYDPMGIALAGTKLVVVDGGNRRIREISMPRFRTPDVNANVLSDASGDYYDVALVGASWVFADAVGDDSICAHIESTLDRSNRFGGRRVRCHSVPVDSSRETDIEDYVKKTFAQEHMDLVIVGAGWWQPASVDPQTFRGRMQSLLDVLGPQKSQLALVWTYSPRAISFSDADWLLNGSAGSAAPSPQERETSLNLEKALQGMPILQYDSYNDLVKYELSGAPPLYRPPTDEHPNPRGNAFLGDHFAQGLLDAGLGKN